MKEAATAKPSSSALLIFAFLLFGGLFYLYYPKIQNYSATPKWIFVVLFSLVILFVGKKLKIPWSRSHSIWISFAGLFLLQSYWSYNFWDAVVRSFPLILAPLAVSLLRREASDTEPFYEKVSFVLALLISPILLLTLVEIAGQMLAGDYSHLATYQFRYTFGNRNQFSELLTLLVPIISVGLFYAKAAAKRLFLGAILFLLYLAVTLLLNRASILVLFIIYPFFLLLFLLQNANLKTRKIAFLGMAVSVLIGLFIVGSPLRNKIPILRNLLETRFGSGNERLQIWKNSVDLWKETPLLGKGSGDWKIEILNTPLGFTKAEESTVFYQRAHNDFIQIAIENGLVGCLLFLAFFVVGLFQLYKSRIESKVKILLTAGIFGYIVLSNFSFPIEKIELLVLLFLFFVPLLTKNEAKQKGATMGRIALAIPLLAIFFLSISWIKNERNYFEYKADNDQLAFSEIDKDFYTIDPTTAPIYWHEGNSFYNQQEYEQALIAYEKAVRYNPNHAHVLNNLGSCHYALGEMGDAEKYYKHALAINPNFIESLMNYTSYLFNTGDIDGALLKIMSIPIHKEPDNYRLYIQAIAKAKYKWLMQLHDDPPFEKFLNKTIDDEEFLYEISKKARISGESYEMELRKYAASQPF
jgi:O-antigen ligase